MILQINSNIKKGTRVDRFKSEDNPKLFKYIRETFIVYMGFREVIDNVH